MNAPRIWVVSELYHPELTSTGYFLTGIAESLADRHDVRAICSQPTYSSRGVLAPWREVRNGVGIERCRSTRLDKDVLPFRLINVVTFTTAVFVKTLRRVRRGDMVLVVTNPPLLPYAVTVAAHLRGARVVLLIHDVFPETLVATGMSRPDSMLVRVIGAASRRLYRSVERIVVLGRDMRSIVSRRSGVTDDRIRTIPNWGDVEGVRPSPEAGRAVRRRHGLEDAFVVQFMGNMGRSHGIEAIAAAARELRDDESVRFMFVGWGRRRAWLEAEIRDGRLPNATLLPNIPQEELSAHLNACDIAIIGFVPGMAGISVPSRMYNVMAAGRPILALTDPDSEVAQVIEEEDIGWVVPADRPERLARAVLDARADPDREAKGRRARAAAERCYAIEHVSEQYHVLFSELEPSGAEPVAVAS